MLRIEFGAGDLGRIRFATAPAPLLETVLILSELRNRPRPRAAGPRDWRTQVSAAFPSESRPLLDLVPLHIPPTFLDVLTADAEEAFDAVRDTATPLHADNVARMERVRKTLGLAPVPIWLHRYANGDRVFLSALDRALRTFHTSCLAPQWRTVTNRFHQDVDRRSATTRDLGVSAMLKTLHPGADLSGNTLQLPYPCNRRVHLDGRGLTLMPSAFWTGHPLVTWDPRDPDQYVLVYPAAPRGSRPPGTTPGIGTAAALPALLGATRAAVLNALRHPRTTGGLADHLDVSVSTASEHATALRDAGLIESHRLGRSVEHRLTRLGHALLNRAV